MLDVQQPCNICERITFVGCKNTYYLLIEK